MQRVFNRIRWLSSASTFSSAVANTFVSRVVSLLLNLGMGITVARCLGPLGRGEVAAVNLWPTLLPYIVTLGIPVALRYELRRCSPEDQAEIFSASLLPSALLGVVAFIIGYFLIPVWMKHYPPELARFAQIMLILAPQIMIQLNVQGFLEARSEFGQANRIAYLPQVLTLAALLILNFLKLLNAYTTVIAYATPAVILTITSMYHVRKSIKFPRAIIRDTRRLLDYGIRAWGLNILATLSLQVDQALVVQLLSAASFAFYTVALSVSRSLLVFSLSLNTVLFPHASSLTAPEAVALVTRGARLIFPITAIIGAGFVLALPALISIAYGKEYHSAIELARILTAEVVLATTVSTLTQAFMATGRPGLVTALQACGILTTIPLMLVFIPRLGLSGAAYSLLISTALRLLMMLACFPLFLRQRIPRLLPYRADVHYLYTKIRAAA